MHWARTDVPVSLKELLQCSGCRFLVSLSLNFQPPTNLDPERQSQGTDNIPSQCLKLFIPKSFQDGHSPQQEQPQSPSQHYQHGSPKSSQTDKRAWSSPFICLKISWHAQWLHSSCGPTQTCNSFPPLWSGRWQGERWVNSRGQLQSLGEHPRQAASNQIEENQVLPRCLE